VKIHICYDIKDTPHGGANQFLKALKSKFIEREIYANNPEDSDIVLFNSHHNINNIVNTKRAFPNKIFVHRIDGPMRLYNDMNDKRDFIVYKLNELADATIFQSQWSYEQNLKLGFYCKAPTAVIHNAPDPEIFNSNYNKKKNNKLRLIATSWSDNMKKGFKYYKFLDENLDFEKYQVLFAGRSPIEFKNVEMLGALSSKDLAIYIKSSDVFITASENDPCSNSLIEALSCKVPAIALNSGGHPELVKQGGYLFENNEDLVKRINDITYNIETCRKNIQTKTINDVTEEYINFFKTLVQ
jgi:glycosyltransferase involved in cell wall biosynthesis